MQARSKTKVLFVVPPNISYEGFVNPAKNVKSVHKNSGDYGAIVTDMPLGILSLSAYIKENGLTQAELVDFNVVLNQIDDIGASSFTGFFDRFFLQPQLLAYNPDLICISALFSPSYTNTLDIARSCRQAFPKAIIVAGGGIPTNMYNEIFKETSSFDALCFGEGEKPLLGLVRAADKIDYLENNDSWITRRKIAAAQPFKYDFIDNLDEIPFLDYDILKIEEYRLNATIAAYPTIDDRNQNIPVMTSRGCPHRCCFCASHTVHGRRMRYYSLERVRNDLKRLKDEYQAKTIIFQDDQFLSSKKRALAIIGMLKQFGLTAFFPNSLALYALDRELLEALKGVGVNQLVLAIESGSDRVLKELMHKPLDLKIVKQVTDDCRALGIYTDVNILIGVPGETKQDIAEAKVFLRSIYANWFRINVATPLVGSEMLDICLKNDYIRGDYMECDYKQAIVETEDFTVDEIQEAAYIMNLDLNFAHNSDFRLGDYKIALKGFENAIRAARDHALAYYYAAQCYDKLGDAEQAAAYLLMAKRITAEKPLWRKYADLLKTPI